ncbi:MAG: M50 family metallopeptidase, partial [Syntrophomonadaceae bacterium]
MTIITALIILAVLILVHEWGHFMVARRIGIPVHEFSLGFGRKLYSTRKNGVEYSLRLIPMGGFVRMAGEEPGDMNDPDGYNNRRPWEKVGVAFSGPFMNFVLAVLIFIYTFAVIGMPQASPEAVIGELVSGKPAASAGLQVGDRILQVNNVPITSWDEFVGMIHANESGTTMQFLVERDAGTAVYNIEPVVDEQAGYPIIGVYPQLQYVRQNVVDAIKLGFIQTYDTTALLLGGLGQLFTGAVAPTELAGPVGITRMVGEA